MNERHIKETLEQSCLQATTRKYPLKYRKQRQELIYCTNFQPYRKRTTDSNSNNRLQNRTTESCKFKAKLGFSLHDVFNTKEKTILELIKDTFEGENMQTQYYVLDCRIDLYFHDHKLAIKVNELGHCDRNNDGERR